jgi:predicted flap endonuclease-1-like 5' DNA nuclease
MGFLLAKILILLAVAAVGGAWFAYWWFRRHYEDITLEYTRGRDEWTSWRRSFEDRLAARPAVDLQPLRQQLAGVDAAVRAINIERVDLQPLQLRLEAMEQRVDSIHMPEAPAPVDLGPLVERLAALEERVAGISIPPPKDLDLNPALLRLAALDTAVRAIHVPDPPAMVDLAPTEARLERLEQAIHGIVIPPARDPDLTPITNTLQQLQARVDSIRMPEAPAPVDLAPVLERLSAMQTRLENPPAPAAPPVPPVAIREGSKNLLSHAGHGKPDDLTQIKGVKRVLERTLHKVGVYYFWQIADWSREDVAHVDSVLPAFKGRIDRDHWVTQASELSTQPSAAKPPGQQH